MICIIEIIFCRKSKISKIKIVKLSSNEKFNIIVKALLKTKLKSKYQNMCSVGYYNLKGSYYVIVFH